MAKSIIKKSFSVLLAMIICVGFMSITAFAEETKAPTHLLGDAEGTPKLFNFKVVDELIPAASEELYVEVGAGEQTEFWTSFLFTTPSTTLAEGVTEGEVTLIDKNGKVHKFYTGAKINEGRPINGIYLDGEFYAGGTYGANGKFTSAKSDVLSYTDSKLQASYNGLQQALLMNGSGKKVAVYCVDHVVSTTSGARYTVANLEDATHYDEETAGKIRAVAANGYWGGIEEIDQYKTLAKVKAMMKASGEFTQDEIDLLSPGVALSATQFALWELANEDDNRQVVNVQYIVKNRVAGYNGASWNTLKNVVPESEVACVDLIFKLSHYLTQLDPIPAVEKTTANTVLTNKVILKEMNIDVLEKAAGHKNNQDTDKNNDAYVTNVTFDMLPVSKNDSLYAKLVDAEGNLYATGRIVGKLQDGEVQLIENANGTYTFPGVTLIENEETTYSVVVEGVQHLERNVYIYTAGARETSQTLIGYDEGKFTVDVESSIKKTFNVDDPTVVINKVDEKGKALTGAEFALYNLDDKLIGEYTVDAAGKIAIYDLAPGTYKLVETKAPAGYIGVAEPMYFTVVGLNGGDFVVHEEYEIEYPGTSYEISNHAFTPAIPQTFVLLDAGMADKWTYAEEYAFGESNFNVVYCGDDKTDLVDDTRYVKKELEDCFDDATAAKLRAIVANSYPYVSMEEMKAASGIDGLTRGDVIAAAQLAIWRYTNADTNDVADGPYYTYKFTYSVKDHPEWGGVFHDYSEEAAAQGFPIDTAKRYDKDYLDAVARIDALYAYLLGLTSVSAEECDVNVYFYVPVGGQDLSQSLIGAGAPSNFYTNGLNIYVKNAKTPEPPTVVVNKVDENGKALAGAKFALYAVTENCEKRIGEYEVDANGKLSIEKLVPGTYKLVETKAPAGYIKAAEPMYFNVVASADGKGFEIEIQGFEVEFPRTAYEISNHSFKPAIPQTFVLLDADEAGKWKYPGEYVFGKSDYNVMYCGDSSTGLVDGTRYVKKALEDCFDDATAAKLRAIVANSYPYVSVKEMETASGIENLTRGDVIAAVQLAIWNQTNGVGYTYRATYSVEGHPEWGLTFNSYADELPAGFPTGTGTMQDTAGKARIDALYDYLLKLDGLKADDCNVNVSYYVAVGGKDVSQSLIGADFDNVYANGLNIYVKNAKAPEPPAPPTPPTVSFKKGEASNINFMLLDPNTGEVEFLKKIDIKNETSFEIPAEAGKVSVVFIKQSTSGMFWFSEEVSEELQNAAITCLKTNNRSYKGHNAVAFGAGNHTLEFKKGKFVTYTFDMGTVDVEAEKAVTEAPKSEAPKPEAPKPEAPKPEAPKQETPKQETCKPEAPKPEKAPAVTVKGAKVKTQIAKDGVTAVYIAANGKIPAVIWTSKEVDAATMAEIIDELGASSDAKTVSGFGPHTIEYQQNKNKTKTVTYTFEKAK